MKAVLRTQVPEAQVAQWKGRHPTPEHYDMLVTGECELYGPSGQLALAVRRGKLDNAAVELARPTLHWMRRFKSDNRADYAGGIAGKRKKADGSLSKQAVSYAEDGSVLNVQSTIAGYFQPQGGRHPFCRASALLINHPPEWHSLQPFLRDIGRLYAETVPLRHKVQMGFVRDTQPAWVIQGTPFTTITVNNTVPAAYHKDGGDLKEGFGVMAVLSHGQFSGFDLVIPAYRVAVRLRDGDVVFFDPTVWHGNTVPFDCVGQQDEDWYRISVVCYYRDGILGCASAEAELAKAKARGSLT